MRPEPLKAYGSGLKMKSTHDNFYSSFQKKLDAKRLQGVENSAELLRKQNPGQTGVVRNGELQPLQNRPAKLSSAMLRKELQFRLGQNSQKSGGKHARQMALNPYQNLDVGEQKLVAATVMNSREKLVAAGHQLPATAVGNQRSRSQLVDVLPQTSGGKSNGKTNGGGFS